MDATTALACLEAAGTEQNRKVDRRHGARDPHSGVSDAAPAIPWIVRTGQRTAARAEKRAAHDAG